MHIIKYPRAARSQITLKRNILSHIIPTFQKYSPLGGRSILNFTLFRHLHLMAYMGLIVPLNRFIMTMDLDLSRLVFVISDASLQKLSLFECLLKSKINIFFVVSQILIWIFLQGVLEGYNGTVFAYGQTGCGKSFSMQGKHHFYILFIPLKIIFLIITKSDTNVLKTYFLCMQVHFQNLRYLIVWANKIEMWNLKWFRFGYQMALTNHNKKCGYRL